MTDDDTDENIVDIDPTEVDNSLRRLGQKKLSVQLVEAARYASEARADVAVCDDQEEAITEALDAIHAAARETWPGDEMPDIGEIAEGDWADDEEGAEE